MSGCPYYLPGPSNLSAGPFTCQAQLNGILGGEEQGHVYLTWPVSLSFVSSSLRLHFPPGRSEQAAATNGCLTLRREQGKALREASRSFRRCKVSISLISPFQSLSWFEVLTFPVLFLFVYFYAKILPELV
jgi:hypothetical protein